MYLVQHSRPMPDGPERHHHFPDAAQAAVRLATWAGAAVVVDERNPTTPVGRTVRWESRIRPEEPCVVFEDLRPDASEKADAAAHRWYVRAVVDAAARYARRRGLLNGTPS